MTIKHFLPRTNEDLQKDENTRRAILIKIMKQMIEQTSPNLPSPLTSHKQKKDSIYYNCYLRPVLLSKMLMSSRETGYYHTFQIFTLNFTLSISLFLA